MIVMVEPGEAGARWVVIKEHSAPDTKYLAWYLPLPLPWIWAFTQIWFAYRRSHVR